MSNYSESIETLVDEIQNNLTFYEGVAKINALLSGAGVNLSAALTDADLEANIRHIVITGDLPTGTLKVSDFSLETTKRVRALQALFAAETARFAESLLKQSKVFYAYNKVSHEYDIEDVVVPAPVIEAAAAGYNPSITKVSKKESIMTTPPTDSDRQLRLKVVEIMAGYLMACSPEITNATTEIVQLIQAQRAQAAAEARADDFDNLVNRLYVTLQERHTVNMQTYGGEFVAPPTRQDAIQQLTPQVAREDVEN